MTQDDNGIGQFFHDTMQRRPAGKVAVWFDDGQEGGWIEWHTPERAAEIEAERDKEMEGE